MEAAQGGELSNPGGAAVTKLLNNNYATLDLYPTVAGVGLNCVVKAMNPDGSAGAVLTGWNTNAGGSQGGVIPAWNSDGSLFDQEITCFDVTGLAGVLIKNNGAASSLWYQLSSNKMTYPAAVMLALPPVPGQNKPITFVDTANPLPTSGGGGGGGNVTIVSPIPLPVIGSQTPPQYAGAETLLTGMLIDQGGGAFLSYPLRALFGGDNNISLLTNTYNAYQGNQIPAGTSSTVVWTATQQDAHFGSISAWLVDIGVAGPDPWAGTVSLVVNAGGGLNQVAAIVIDASTGTPVAGGAITGPGLYYVLAAGMSELTANGVAVVSDKLNCQVTSIQGEIPFDFF